MPAYAMHRNGEQVRVQGRYTLAVDDGNAYIAAGLAGLGIPWLPDYMARPHLARGEFVPLFQDRQLDSMPIYVAFPPNRHVSVKVRVFIDWVIELMAEHAPVGERGRLDWA
ncbi:LysR protein [Pseudomonas syringae pv. antirrhini]|uniref:LysR protein n=1 Tax=Pseudomonas syringae pv. antirrhini TaxID=251702 RepID=A0A0N8QPI7_9PSED|nr:LysR protein [Pseudomonas syringae pv. antirrhini]RMP33908.1 LysR protein [Pseudomonas syringae pv. antirrhini]RMP44827.1 LysR protein [Pseudomonas syringae pv. antirrhini]RMW21993.1 LysR protein [Pseudomonas syringae pv. antirrhini]